MSNQKSVKIKQKSQYNRTKKNYEVFIYWHEFCLIFWSLSFNVNSNLSIKLQKYGRKCILNLKKVKFWQKYPTFNISKMKRTRFPTLDRPSVSHIQKSTWSLVWQLHLTFLSKQNNISHTRVSQFVCWFLFEINFISIHIRCIIQFRKYKKSSKCLSK